MHALQKQIIEALQVQPQIIAEVEVRRSIDFMKDYLTTHPFLKTLVLGISGGQDSTLVGKMAQIAVEELRQETNNADYQFIAVRLPYGQQNDEEDAVKALKYIQPDQVVTVNIKASTDHLASSLQEASQHISDFNKGNIKARIRMVTQYAIAGQNSGVVLGTDHAAESVTGFFTKFGDGSADIMPLWRLNKRQGKQMLIYLDCPPQLYMKTPVADLEDNKPMQADEAALGVSYEMIDDYLEGKQVPEEAARTIEDWYLKTQHKRKLPITVFDNFWRQ